MFYEARADAQPLPFPSAFLAFPEDAINWPYNPVGVVWTPSIKDNFQGVKPTALGQGYCGTREDFASGGIYDPSLPPVRRLPSGLPLCCSPILEGLGGGVGGGAATVIFTPWGYGSGGGVGGGSATVTHTPVEIASGGGLGGGTSPVVWSADVGVAGGGLGGGAADVIYTAPPVPGATCATALPILSGVAYPFGITPAADQWFTFPVIPGGGSWTVTITGSTGGFLFTFAYHGTCASLTPDGSLVNNGTIPASSAGSPFTGYVWVSTGVTDVYTIQFDQL